MSKLKLLFLVFLSFLSPIAFSQAIKAIEKDLVNTFAEHQAYQDSINELIRHDSTRLNAMVTMTHLDSLCLNKMLYYTSTFPQTMGMDFKILREQDVNIMTSDDSLFRIYVWNERKIVSGPVYKAVFQYKSGNKVKSCVLPHSDTSLTKASLAFYYAIYTVTIKNKTYYFATYQNRYNLHIREEGIKAFIIEKGRLNDTVRIIKTETGLHNELSYKYDVTISGDEGSDNGIVYDTNKVSVEIPVVLDDGKMTSDHITYQLKGRYFEKAEEKKEK